MEINQEINGESYVLVLSKDGRDGVALDKWDDPVAEVTGASDRTDCRNKLIQAVRQSE